MFSKWNQRRLDGFGGVSGLYRRGCRLISMRPLLLRSPIRSVDVAKMLLGLAALPEFAAAKNARKSPPAAARP
jgi:hypothetical protein